jgi:Kef-type K+ transport system membrane component KefB
MEAVINLFENDIIALGVLLLGGFFGGKIVNKFKLPAVTGYLLAGILLGHFDIIHSGHLEQYHFIEVLGLSIVALIIGGSLHLGRLKRIGRSVFVITIVQVLGAFVVVFGAAKLFLDAPLGVCILLGAIASATAPASPVTVIRELRAEGPLTENLLTVVALDDAACLMLFGIAAAAVNILSTGRNSLSLFLLPLWEILGSILVGAAVGWVILQLLKRIRDRHEIVIVMIGISVLVGELGEHVGLSALLLNMSSGMMLANFYPHGDLFHILEDIELPVFVVFFTLAGASLDIKMLLLNFALAVVYIIARGVGKVGGAFLGASISNAPEVVKKYLGFAMLSQAGVAIALVLAVQDRFPWYGTLINAVVLAAVTFNELIGPVGTKYALTRAGEARRRHLPRGETPHNSGPEQYRSPDKP